MHALADDFRTYDATTSLTDCSDDGARRPWPTRVGMTLGAIGLLVTVAGAIGQWLKCVRGVQHSFGFVHQFGPDDEGNLATWYSSTVMLLCAGLLAFIAVRCASAWSRRRWWGLAVLFVAMSADESAQLHEMTISPLHTCLGTHGALHFGWVVPGAAFVLLVGILLIGFLRRLPRRSCVLFLVAGGIYVSGALGLEMLGGWYAERHGVERLGYASITVLEEAMELTGLILFAYSLCDHVRRTAARETFSVQPIAASGRDGPVGGRTIRHFAAPAAPAPTAAFRGS
jgi:hypothetical protein